VTPMTQLLVVFRKELKDAFRDRRAIMTIVLSATISPILLGFMMNRMADRQRQLDSVTIPVVGASHAPAFVDWLRQQTGITVTDGPSDPEAAVRESREDVVVVVPEDFQKKFRSSKPAPIKLVLDTSRQAARPKVDRVRGLIERYSGEIGTLRLINRGVSPAITQAVAIERVEVSSAQARAAAILNFIPMFILLAAFGGGMQIAMDSTAGERERGSLEPLLVNPSPRWSIAGGKWLAASFTAALSMLLTTVLVLVMLRFIPMQEFGMRFGIQPLQVAMLLAATLPLALLASAIQTYLATFAKSFKEAQSYMGLLILLPMIPGFVSAIYPLTGQPWMYPVPIIAQQVLAGDVIAARVTPWWAFVVAAASALLLSMLLLQMTTRLLQRERIIFTR